MAAVPTKFSFLPLFPLNPSPISPHQDQACGMRWLKWVNILMIFFSKFLCILFSYIYILIRIISLAKALGHTEKKNERNKRVLHVDTWVFLTLLRASLAVLGTALYLHMWRAKMKIYCSSSSSSDSSNCQNATVTFHK
jgi:hypothetical protein